MGLENPFFLADFISGNPASQDQRHEGDDHIRNLKVALKNTFPGMGGRAWRKRNVTASGPINLTDNMTVLNTTGGLVLTPAAAATLGNGFIAYIKASGGSVTIEPTEPINGVDDFIVPEGYIAILFCDGTEFFTLLAYSTIPSTTPVFPPGTKMLFNQTTPPTGWTKITSAIYDNAGLRMTTGTVGSGGGDVFTTVFNGGKSTAGFSLSEGHNGPHSHSTTFDHQQLGGGSAPNILVYPGSGIGSIGAIGTSGSGSGSAHAHGVPSMNLKYIDLIAASKD